MRDARQKPLQGVGQLPFHALHVIDVVLQLEIIRANLVEEGNRLSRAVQKESRNVVGIDRLGE